MIIGIKQKDGTNLEGEYKDGKVIFTKPAKMTVKTDGSLEQIIQDFKARKLVAFGQSIDYSGQVRNNKIVIQRTKTYSFGEDPALAKAKKYKNNNITQYPVIIDTGIYRDKQCFILTFTWELANAIKDKNKVQNLGHVFTAIIDEDGNEIAYATCS